MHHCVPLATGSVGRIMSKTGQKRAVCFGMCPVLTAEGLSPSWHTAEHRYDLYLEKLVIFAQQVCFAQNV